MNETPSSPRCPDCGAPIPAHLPEGVCPRCVLARVAAPTEPAPLPGGSRPPPPSREAVAAAFPQLEVIEWIGQGGMGCVFKARQPQLGRLVALKILPESLARDAAFADRFAREARTLAALNHPNIVTIHDFGRAGGFFYLLMEFVDGVNLRQALQAGRFTPEEALAIVPPLCEALQYAHERGVVHRDIKPENLLLDRDGRIKIADFGVARILGGATAGDGPGPSQAAREPPAAMGTGAVAATASLAGWSAAGTPGYMAPEQMSSPHSVDRRADIYSLGVVLYEMLTGELPAQPIVPPSQRLQVDVRLDEIVLRALDREPERRYQHARDVRTAVETVRTPPASPAPGDHRQRQRRLWYGFTVSLLGLPVGLLLNLPIVWGLALAGIGVGAAKLRLLDPTEPGSHAAPPGSRFAWPAAWLARPAQWRRRVRGGLLLLAFVLTVNFAAPHYSVLGSGDTRVWTLGLTTPWLADVERFLPGGATQREGRIHTDRFSFACGPLALAVWFALGLLQRVEAGRGLLVLVQPAAAPGGRPRIHWRNVLLAWAAVAAISAVGMGLMLAVMQAVLGGAPPPLPALLWACIPPTLVVGLRGLGAFPRPNPAGEAVDRRRMLAIIAAVVLVVAAMPPVVTFLTLAVLNRVRTAPPPPAVSVRLGPPAAGFEGVREVVLHRAGDLRDAFLDLESARILSAPEPWVESLRAAGHLSRAGSISIFPILDWMRTNHADLVCRDGLSGLTLVDGMGVLVAPGKAGTGAFDTQTAKGVRHSAVALAEALSVHTNREPGAPVMFWFEPHPEEHTWVIRTRSGRAGVLDLRPEDVRRDTIRFRYKLLATDGEASE